MGQFSSIRYGSRVVNNTLNVFYRCGHSIVFCNFAICLRKFNFAKCFNTLSRKCNSHFFPRRQICCVHFNDTNRPSRGFERTGIIVSVTRLGELLDFGQLWKLLAKINLPKSSTFLGVSKSIIFGQLLETFGNFFLVTLVTVHKVHHNNLLWQLFIALNASAKLSSLNKQEGGEAVGSYTIKLKAEKESEELTLDLKMSRT